MSPEPGTNIPQILQLLHLKRDFKKIHCKKRVRVFVQHNEGEFDIDHLFKGVKH